MAAASSTASNSLTLSSATFAKLSPHPYLLANLQPPEDVSSPSSGPRPPSARANGRQPRQARQPHINTSSLSHAHGSAVVRTGDTTVICGVRGETLPVSQIPNYRAANPASVTEGGAVYADGDDDHHGHDHDHDGDNNHDGDGDGDGDGAELRDYDLLVPNIELATGCAPSFLPGAPPTALAQTLSTRVYSLLHGAGLLDPADLRIFHHHHQQQQQQQPETTGTTTTTTTTTTRGGERNKQDEAAEPATSTSTTRGEVKAYWVLYIDLLFISFDGNPFDAAWAAVVAALRDTRLPRAYWDPDREMVLCSRGSGSPPPPPLRVRGLPVACTAAVFTARERQKRNKGGGRGGDGDQYWILVDPDRFEEGLCDETITVVVDRSPRRGGAGAEAEADGDTRILGISKSGGTVVGPQVLGRFVAVAEERWQVFKNALG